MERFVEANGIRIHCLDYPSDGPTIILLHGLTANAHSFDGLVDAGLSSGFRVLALDLRGRGLSDHPDDGYSVRDHADDVIGLMDELEIDEAILVGHSFGGMLTYDLAARYPDRLPKAVAVDAPPRIDPELVEQIKPSLDRLGTPVPSWDAYLRAVKAQPYFADWWDPKLEGYYRADVRDNPDGTVQARSRPENIMAAIVAVTEHDWAEVVSRVQQPMLVIRATEPYGPRGSPPVLSREEADEVVALLGSPRFAEIPANHVTVLFGEHARALVGLITEFVAV